MKEIILDFRVGERARNGASLSQSEYFEASGSESETADKYNLKSFKLKFNLQSFLLIP